MSNNIEFIGCYFPGMRNVSEVFQPGTGDTGDASRRIQLRTGDEVARCVVGLRKSECDEGVPNIYIYIYIYIYI